jgi:hypothetical protein
MREAFRFMVSDPERTREEPRATSAARKHEGE